MPKVPISYNNCCIYKIEHIEDESLLYVGFTTNFNKRKGDHKIRIKNVDNKKYKITLYEMRREHGGWEMIRMIEIEKNPCNDKQEAEKRETEIKKELKANMNSVKSYTNDEERVESKKERFRIYRETHKEEIKERGKLYRETHKEEIKRKDEMYRETHKEEIKEKRKKRYEKSKELKKELTQS